MKPDLVYVLKDGTGENWEFRQSLALAHRFLKNHGRLVVVTDRLPFFLDPEQVLHVEETDREHVKDANIFNKVLAACRDPRVSPDFLFLNDDHFMVSETDAAAFPDFHKGPLPKPNERIHNTYQRRLMATGKILREMGLPFLNYDVHTPIIYNKEKFLEVGKAFGTVYRKALGMVVKSAYGNYWRVGGLQIDDLKFYHPMRRDELVRRIEGRLCFSTADNCRSRALTGLLRELGGDDPPPWTGQQMTPSADAESIAAREEGPPSMGAVIH